jgi:hypothetical protein
VLGGTFSKGPYVTVAPDFETTLSFAKPSTSLGSVALIIRGVRDLLMITFSLSMIINGAYNLT